MKETQSSYEGYATREGFNVSVRHVKTTLGIIQEFGDRQNLADSINQAIDAGSVTGQQVPAIAAMILADKFGYSYAAKNLENPLSEDYQRISDEIAKWNAVDLFAIYYHPDVGPIAINPKNPEQWKLIGQLRRNELLTAFAGDFGKTPHSALAARALEKFFALVEGESAKIPPEILKGKCAYAPPKAAKESAPKKVAGKRGRTPKKVAAVASATQAAPAAAAATTAPLPTAAPPPAVPSGPKRMTPMYMVPVTNELFHNGNVEAWKRIIASYNAVHPKLEVIVYYDGERIVNINSLFKWGKVKRGSSIMFCVAGEDIKDVAKLQKYFRQGASNQFEAFLVGSPGSVMNLF
jgi:hypothetical protein